MPLLCVPSPIYTMRAPTIPHSNAAPHAPRRSPPLHASATIQAPACSWRSALALPALQYNAHYYRIILQDIKPNVRAPLAHVIQTDGPGAILPLPS